MYYNNLSILLFKNFKSRRDTQDCSMRIPLNIAMYALLTALCSASRNSSNSKPPKKKVNM